MENISANLDRSPRPPKKRRLCRYNPDVMDQVKYRMNDRRTIILGYQTRYSEFYMFDANRSCAIEQLELMLQESKEKLDLMDDEFKTKFLEKEILSLQQYILKAYAKQGIDKTQHEVFFLYEFDICLQFCVSENRNVTFPNSKTNKIWENSN